ncbi:MAG: ABC transporter ATP-binding protein, partial [Parvibaculaceae bacterium]
VNHMHALGIKPELGTLIFIAASALVLKSFLGFIAFSYAGYAVAHVSTGIRRRMLDALFAARWSYFVGHRTGRIANALSNDATRAGDAYNYSARSVAYTLQASVYVLVSFLISPKLAAAGLLVGLIFMFTLGRLVKAGRQAGYRQTDRTAELVTYVSDALNNIKPIKTMERKAYFLEFFSKKIRSLKRALIARALAKQGFGSGQEALQVIAAAIGAYWAAVHWGIPLAEMVVVGVIFVQVIAVLAKIQTYVQATAEVESAYWRSMELTEELVTNREVDAGTLTPTLEKDCRFDNVSFGYGETEVIRDTSFDIPAGKITVLRGPSGAGKTTLIDLLIGLHRPTSGEVTIDGVSLNQISLKAWRRMIGYAPQELVLLHGSIRENVDLGDAEIDDEAVMEALRRAGAADFVAAMPAGLDTVVGEMGAKLSGGQRQRIALARALVLKPKLLILDEVTSALDPDTEAEICQKVRSLAGDLTIVAITHRDAWTAIADRLYRVEGGKAVPVTERSEALQAAQ